MSNIDLAMVSKSIKWRRMISSTFIYLNTFTLLQYFNIWTIFTSNDMFYKTLRASSRLKNWKTQSRCFLLKSLFQTLYVFWIITSNDKTESPSHTEIFQLVQTCHRVNNLTWTIRGFSNRKDKFCVLLFYSAEVTENWPEDKLSGLNFSWNRYFRNCYERFCHCLSRSCMNFS